MIIYDEEAMRIGRVMRFGKGLYRQLPDRNGFARLKTTDKVILHGYIAMLQRSGGNVNRKLVFF